MRKRHLISAMLLLSCTLLFAGCKKEPEGHKDVQEGALQIEVDNTTTYQNIDGFGAGYTYYSNYAYYNPYKEEIYDLLFKDALVF